MLNLSEAARDSGQSKSAIWRAVKSGRLSATRTYTGDYQIDPAELHRVFSPGADGRATDGGATPVSMKRDPTELERAEAALMQSQIVSPAAPARSGLGLRDEGFRGPVGNRSPGLSWIAHAPGPDHDRCCHARNEPWRPSV